MSTGAAWGVLVIAGLFEVAWAIGLKYTDGFTRLAPSLLTVGAMAASVVLLARTVRVLPVGTAYAVWTGIGVLGTAALAIFLFGESASPMRLAGIGLILLGMVLLKLAASA